MDQVPDAGATVTLREISQETVGDVIALTVRPEQQHYIASNAVSIAEAHYHPQAWFRAIYADETPVGFIMLHDENLREKPEIEHFYALWRLMIDAEHQGKGYGAQAMRLLVEHVSSNPSATEVLTSYIPGDDGPEGFYLKLGFEHTGRMVHGDREMRLRLK